MRAKEAPEKLYITYKGYGVFDEDSTVERTKDSQTEYTRTDAFIEKATEYFRRCLEDTEVIDDYRNILVRGIQASYTSVEEFIDDFKNYIKRE